MAEPARKLPEESRPIIRPDLTAYDGENKGDGVPAGNLREAEENPSENPYDTDDSTSAQEGSEQPEQESGDSAESGGQSKSGKNSLSSSSDSKSKSSGDEDGGLYRDDSNDKRSRLGRFRQGAQNMKSRALNNKLMLGLGVGSAGFIVIMIIFFAFALGGYKVVQFTEHVAAYQFARTSRQSYLATKAITEEKLGLSTVADDSARAALKNAYTVRKGKVQAKTSEYWSKLDKYRPNKIISNYDGNGGKVSVKLNEAETRFGNVYYKSITYNGREIPIETKTLAGSAKNTFIPGYKFRTRDLPITRNFASTFLDELRAKDIGPITRAKVARQVRADLNISLTAWVVGKYAGLTEEESKAKIERDAYKAANAGESLPVADLANEEQKGVATEVAQATDEAVNDKEGIKQIVENPNEQPQGARQKLQEKIGQAAIAGADSTVGGAVKKIIGFINPIYGVAVPVCLVYDGSMVKAGPTIKNQTEQLQRTGLKKLSEGAQLKNGYDVDPEAVGASDWKLGDISYSNAEIRASGGRADTSNYESVQSSPTGNYTIADVGFGKAGLPGLGSATNDVLDELCPVATNVWLGAGIGVAYLTAKIAAIAGSGGGAAAGTTVTEEAAKTVATNAVTKTTDKLVAKYIALKQAKRQVASTVGDFAKRTAVSGGLIFGATMIAQQIVQNSIAANHSSLSTGPPNADDAESGVNMYANQINNRQYYGAPLADSELNQDNKDNVTQLAQIESEKPAFERYLSPKNPNSLASRTAIIVNQFVRPSSIAKIFRTGAGLVEPYRNIGQSMQRIFGTTSFASTPVTSVNTYFGNVQFGYTKEESAIMQKEEYKPGNNRRVLDASEKEDEIEGIYSACFDGSKDISVMLTEEGKNQDDQDEYYIVRNDDGNVIGGICSQQNVGPHNKKYGDLVFRWRIAHSYDNQLDQLIDQQEITATREPVTPANSGSDSSVSSSNSSLNTDAAIAAAKSSSAGRTNVGFALYDSDGNKIGEYNADDKNYGASITKSMILVAYLKQVGSGKLKSDARSDLTSMIQQSNNDAANRIYGRLSNGPGAIKQVASQAGMTGFVFSDSEGKPYILGQSKVTAADFAKFFAKIDQMIPSTNRSFALGLLSNVSPQTGLLQAGLPGTVYAKEGWKPEASGLQGAPYVVNQAAQFQSGGKTYGVAVTVGGTSDQDSGEAIVKKVVSKLTGGD